MTLIPKISEPIKDIRTTEINLLKINVFTPEMILLLHVLKEYLAAQSFLNHTNKRTRAQLKLFYIPANHRKHNESLRLVRFAWGSWGLFQRKGGLFSGAGSTVMLYRGFISPNKAFRRVFLAPVATPTAFTGNLSPK
jgi:hypothetical protein